MRFEFCRPQGVARNPRSDRGLTPAGLSTTTAASAAATLAIPSINGTVNAEDWIQPLEGIVDDAAESTPTHPALQVLSRYRALVLDSSYRPIDIVNWQRAICMEIMEKADVLEYYNATISSVSEQWFLPAVLRARWYGGQRGRLGRVVLNRRNLMLRDKFSCQYCGKRGGTLTLDHVIPQSKGGGNSWTNLVTACSTCNTKKGDKTLKQLKWKLRKEPREPSPWEINVVIASIGTGENKQVPPEWAEYIFTSNDGS